MQVSDLKMRAYELRMKQFASCTLPAEQFVSRSTASCEIYHCAHCFKLQMYRRP